MVQVQELADHSLNHSPIEEIGFRIRHNLNTVVEVQMKMEDLMGASMGRYTEEFAVHSLGSFE